MTQAETKSGGTGAGEITTLIVDDQEDIRLLLRTLIDTANEGLRVVGEAASGVEAIEQATLTEPLVIVFDEMMPNMTGVEAARHVRRLRPAQIIILCTAYLDDDVISRARTAGINAWLPKEQVSDLPDLIRSIVRERIPSMREPGAGS